MAKSKKELDRDMMFRKIMPALADNPFSTPVADQRPVSEVPEVLPTAEAAVLPPPMSIPAPTPVPVSVPVSEPVPEPAPEESPGAPTEPRPVSRRVELPVAPKDDPPDDDLSVLRARLFARSGVGGLGPEPVSTINLMESLVLKHLDEVVQRFNCCRCDRCRRDIAAYALNLLPAQYIVADPGNMDKMEQKISKNVVFDALVKAVLQVRLLPRH